MANEGHGCYLERLAPPFFFGLAPAFFFIVALAALATGRAFTFWTGLAGFAAFFCVLTAFAFAGFTGLTDFTGLTAALTCLAASFSTTAPFFVPFLRGASFSLTAAGAACGTGLTGAAGRRDIAGGFSE